MMEILATHSLSEALPAIYDPHQQQIVTLKLH